MILRMLTEAHGGSHCVCDWHRVDARARSTGNLERYGIARQRMTGARCDLRCTVSVRVRPGAQIDGGLQRQALVKGSQFRFVRPGYCRLGDRGRRSAGPSGRHGDQVLDIPSLGVVARRCRPRRRLGAREPTAGRAGSVGGRARSRADHRRPAQPRLCCCGGSRPLATEGQGRTGSHPGPMRAGLAEDVSHRTPGSRLRGKGLSVPWLHVPAAPRHSCRAS